VRARGAGGRRHTAHRVHEKRLPAKCWEPWCFIRGAGGRYFLWMTIEPPPISVVTSASSASAIWLS